VRIGRARLTAVLEVFNLLNSAKELEEHVVTDSSFRTTTVVQPPRAVRIGVRVGF